MEHWAVRSGYEGIAPAGPVVNARSEADAGGAARLLDDLARLRRDRALAGDVLGWRGSRRPITAVAADLADPRHGGTRKAVARLRRVVNAAAGQPESTWE